jgi:hypothetical protein
MTKAVFAKNKILLLPFYLWLRLATDAATARHATDPDRPRTFNNVQSLH